MSERTAPAISKLDELLNLLRTQPASREREDLIGQAEALRRAVAAFHMEAIRFRMYSVDRMLGASPEHAPLRRVFDETRQALEAAGFHTRSHGDVKA